MSVGRLRAKLFGFLAVVLVLVAITIAGGNKPLLGLDLQGGISVVLEPVGTVKPGSLDVAVDIIRSRVDSLGVAEPEISRQGNNIVVDLPGVSNRDKALRLVGQTAELRFRPVLANVPAEGAKTTTTTTTAPGSTTTTGADGATTTTTVPADTAAAQATIASCDPTAISALTTIPTTTRAADRRNVCVVLPLRTTDTSKNPGRLLLGPTELTGNDVSSAKAQYQAGSGYTVAMNLNGAGLTKFNALAAKSYGKTPPQDQVAIVLDGIVQSNPAFQTPNFNGAVQISGNFSSTEANDLAKLINYGALPVVLKQVNVENVSPSLGKDQLHAGILAGIIGLALVAIYMLAFYRILGLVVIAGIMLSGMALFTLVAWLLPALGITIVLGLSGVTGIIVSVGITVDSYIVYFEKMKDELRAGATVRSSVDRSFTKSFRTILAADLVSLIGAVVLYVLAIGSVRGFALFLGISTVLDLLVSYFFMHPIVSILARKPHLVRMKGFGIGAGLDHPEVVA